MFSFVIEQALLERSSQFNVELQIMPRLQPDHTGIDGPLLLLESRDNTWYGSAEGQRGGMLITQPEEVGTMLQRYARLRWQALNSKNFRSLLRQLRGAP